jgi:hypothetical protein
LNADVHAIESRIVNTSTFDDIVTAYCSSSERILVKIDVQGSELAVIETLSIKHQNVVAIILETSFLDLYIEGGKISDVVIKLRQKGFEVISIKEKGYLKSLKRFSYCDLYAVRSHDTIQ